MVTHNPYEILGVDENATLEEITDAYRCLLRDCYLKDERQFKQIVRAYLLLCRTLEDNLPAPSPDIADTTVAAIARPIIWIRSHRLIGSLCAVGGILLLGFAAYKTFQLGKVLGERLGSSTTLVYHISSEKAPLSSTVTSAVSTGSSATLGAVWKACKWTAGSAATTWQWTADKVSTISEKAPSSSTVTSAVSTGSSATLGAVWKACKWTAGSAATTWQWTADKVSTISEKAPSSSTVTSTVSTMSKIWKWTTGQG